MTDEKTIAVLRQKVSALTLENADLKSRLDELRQVARRPVSVGQWPPSGYSLNEQGVAYRTHGS